VTPRKLRGTCFNLLRPKRARMHLLLALAVAQSRGHKGTRKGILLYYSVLLLVLTSKKKMHVASPGTGFRSGTAREAESGGDELLGE
jgi:hypothetical protein